MHEQAQLAHASAFLRDGKVREAEAVCRNLLSLVPRNAAATHLLGLIRKDAGDVVGGEQLIRKSIELEPACGEFRANLANLLRRLGRLQEAEHSYRESLGLDPTNRSARLGLARTLNDLGQHAAAETECRSLVRANPQDAVAWSALAMTLRDQQRLADAEAAYRRSLTANPRLAATHHNLGALLAQMERAEESLEALERAQLLGLRGFELEFNRGRALTQLYRLDDAEQAFAQAVALDPLNGEAQVNLARIRFMRGDPNFARDVRKAAAAHRDNPSPQLLLAEIMRRSGELRGAESLLRDLLARRGSLPKVRGVLAAVLNEAGNLDDAEHEALEAAGALPNDPAIIDTLVTVLLERGRPGDAMPFIRNQRSQMPHAQGWIAHEATAARLLGHSLYRELYDYQRLVRTYEVDPPAGWSSMAELNAALIAALNVRHQWATHPLDQSLRNGSQTARNLLTDPHPAIQAILRAFAAPIADYRQAMGSDAAHPLSARNRGATQMVGAWSVQLRREGFHVNHVHPEGWISSAYYVSVPEEVNDPTLMSGWIKFGEPRFPVPNAPAEVFVRPRPGRLVLFPSYMWHGTNAIHGPDVRTTIAFDAVPADGR